MQWTIRKRFSGGVQFDFKLYVFKIDRPGVYSGEQCHTPGFSSLRGSTSIINSWFTNDMKAVSDYDVQHNFSALWIVELPFGKGKPLLGEREPGRSDVTDRGCSLWAAGRPVGVRCSRLCIRIQARACRNATVTPLLFGSLQTGCSSRGRRRRHQLAMWALTPSDRSWVSPASRACAVA